MRREMDTIIEEQIQQGIVEECKDGPWAGPALLVAKKDYDGTGQRKWRL